MNNNSCTLCDRTLDTTQGRGDDFVILLPCKCMVCPKCSFQMCCNRKFESPRCEQDNQIVAEAVFFESSRTAKKQGHVVTIEKLSPDLDKDPCRTFMQSFSAEPSIMTNKMILSLSYTHKPLGTSGPLTEEFSPATITSVLDSEHGFETIADEQNLRTIFGLLHDPIMTKHRKDLKKKHPTPRMTPAEFCEYCLEEDDSLLLQLLYSLSTGRMTITPSVLSKAHSPRSKNLLSEYLAVCVAKCMIERANTDAPGPLQLMVGDVLSLLNANNDVKSFMSKIRLSAGKRTIDRMNIKVALQDALTKLKLEPLDAFCLHLDNFGFHGRQAVYSQHTVVQIARIRANNLRRLGFYDEYKVSRLGTSLDELLEGLEDGHAQLESKERRLAKSIAVPTKQDYALLSKRVLTTLQSAVDLTLPNPDECRGMP
jgi:hypothetical protein